MTYELAKKLKDTIYPKTCKECNIPYVGGNKSFRCKTCQSVARKEANKVWQKKYYENNKSTLNKKNVARQVERYKSDPVFRENNLTKGHNRRSLIEGNGGKHTTKEWLDVLHKHEYRCAKCKRSNSEVVLTRDHIIPISKGGTNCVNNIQPLCGSCNSSKGNKI